MIQQPVIQTILNVSDGLFGLRYLKIIKSPSGPHFIVDVMFKEGLRLTSDILPGQPAKHIGMDLHSKAQFYRLTDYETLKPAIDFVGECSERVLSGEDGLIAECQLRESALREAWEMTLFRRYMKVVDQFRTLEYERAVEALKEFYSGNNSSVGID